MAENGKLCSRCRSPLTKEMVGGICAACLLEEMLPAAEGLSGSVAGGPVADDVGILQRFGPYELLEEIGRGGMGVIYKARHPGLDRIVAVKMLLAGEFADPKARERLLREARTAARLSHPGIVTIHDVGEVRGRPYFAMEYVPGCNLAQIARDGLLPVATAVRYVEQIARAVHYAHEHGVIHRDLKPANVLISPDDEAKLTDFGLTKSLAEPTRTVESAGSPNYMAPEQADSTLGTTGTHTDVFGLGAILYHLLTGRPPAVGESLAETLRAVAQGEPVPLRQLRPALPRDLETITLKCLEKEPVRRFHSAQEVADELVRWQNREPIHARPLTALEVLIRWARRNPQTAALGVGLVATVILGAEGVIWQWRRAETAIQRADKEEADAQWKRIVGAEALHPMEVSLADVNRDGWLDIVAAPIEDGTVAIFLGQATGEFAPAPGSPVQVPGVRAGADMDGAVAVADLDGDGVLDLAVANETSDTLTLLKGEGSGRFALAGAPIPTGRMPRQILAADVDGNGRPDLLVSNYGEGSISVMLWSGGMNFVAAAGSPLVTAKGPWGMASADFNGDRRMDLAVATDSGVVAVYLGAGSGGFVAGPGSPFSVGGGAFDVTVADVDEDGHPDLVTAVTRSHTVAVLLGDGRGNFRQRVPSQSIESYHPRRVQAADFDRDGHLDLVTANESGNLSLLKGDGRGAFLPVGSRVFEPGMVAALAVGDLDHDGLPDVVVCGHDFGITMTRNPVLLRLSRWGAGPRQSR